MQLTPPWGKPLLLAFRFTFVCVGAFVLGESGVLAPIVPWFGLTVLRLAEPIDSSFNGSGDRLFHYVQLALVMAVSLVGAAVWTALARRCAGHPRLHDLMRIVLRYGLAMSMIGYGLAKVFPMQFPTPEPDRLVQQFGNASPMGLLWTFMGASPAYAVFAGVMEVTAGALLLWRRTTTVGALLCAGVMLNVLMLNMCYDVPVKIFSAQLLAFALILALPDMPMLVRALVMRRAVEPAAVWTPFDSRGMNITARVGRAVLVLGVVVTTGLKVRDGMAAMNKPVPADFGVWRVEEFVRGGEVVPPLLTDADRWRRVCINSYGNASIHSMTGKVSYRMVEENSGGKLRLVTPQWEKEKETIEFTRTDPEVGTMVLDGMWKGGPLKVTLKRTKPEDFLLHARGFHWVNDTPPNY